MSDREYESCKVIKLECASTIMVRLELETAHDKTGEYLMYKSEAIELARQLLEACDDTGKV